MPGVPLGDQMDREEVLRLIVAQLQEYDFPSVAQVVATATGLTDYSLDPSPRLAQLAHLGAQAEAGDLPLLDDAQAESDDVPMNEKPTEAAGLSDILVDKNRTTFGQLIFMEKTGDSAPLPPYTPGFTGKHNGIISSLTISPDGKFAATAGYDNTIRILDMDVMDDLLNNRVAVPKNDAPVRGGVPGEYDNGPVYKSLFDNSGVIHDLSFHPSGMILAGCFEDHHIRFYDISRSSSRKSFRYIPDTFPVYSIAFYPCGQYLVAGTAHSSIRMYDVRSFRCFTASAGGSDDTTTTVVPGGAGSSAFGSATGTNASAAGAVPAGAPSGPASLLTSAITTVRMSADGRQFATASGDGTVRLWDATGGRCTSTWRHAHNGHRVTSLQWSKSGAYLLTSGADGTARLWETASGRTLKAYYGAVSSAAVDAAVSARASGPAPTAAMVGAAAHGVASFSWDERHVLGTALEDDGTGQVTSQVVAWDALTGDVVGRFDSMHRTGVARVASSQHSPALLTYGDDGKFRYWGVRDADIMGGSGDA
ncbi:hypothetical protein GGF31_007579 [Allomyces arbusculus]|nr:hypothetical protein GGF31_007579 [Allomyces arbusculus]